MGICGLVHLSRCKWKTVGCRFKYQNITGTLSRCYIHTNTRGMNTIAGWGTCAAHFTFCIRRCIYYVHIFLCAVCCMCQRTSDFCMWHLMFTSCGLALLFVWALPHLIPALGSSPLEGFIPPADPEDLCRFRLVCLSHPHSPAAVLLLNTACVIHHVVMSCQKQPWQMLLFCLWNDHVGLKLQTTIIVHSWLLCTCKICFVGMRCHNSKAGGRFICKVNEIQHSSLTCQLLWKNKKSWENNREDTSVINGQTCRFITEQHTLFPYSKWPQRTYSMKQSTPVTAQYDYCISLTPPLMLSEMTLSFSRARTITSFVVECSGVR